MKRIVICIDGTWQSLSQDNLTNIGIIARSVAHKEDIGGGNFIHQTVIYTQGVGTTMGALARRSFFGEMSASLNRMAGGAFGEGLEDGILDAYLRLSFNYEDGDEIYIFGFSRGAFAARRLAGLINTSGIVSRRHADKAREAFRIYYDKPRDSAPEEERIEHDKVASQFRMLYGKGARNVDGTRRQTDDVPPITYLGVFDTVVQRGFSDVLASVTPLANKQLYSFKNLRVCPNVLAARHAVALDENRGGFRPMLWTDLEGSNAKAGKTAFEQRWFVGTHGNIGGGEASNLSARALKWVAEGAAQCGLRFYGRHGDDTSPLEETLNQAGLAWDGPISRPTFWKSLQPQNWPWHRRKVWDKRTKPHWTDAEAAFDSGVFERAEAEVRPRYMPRPLRPFRKALKERRREDDSGLRG